MLTEKDFNDIYAKWKDMSDEDRSTFVTFLGMLSEYWDLGSDVDFFNATFERAGYDDVHFRNKLPLKWQEALEEKEKQKKSDWMKISLEDECDELIVKKTIEETMNEGFIGCHLSQPMKRALMHAISENLQKKSLEGRIQIETNLNYDDGSMVADISITDNVEGFPFECRHRYDICLNGDSVKVEKLK